MMDMSPTDKDDIMGGMCLALLVESTSIGSSSTAKVELRFLGAAFTTGELSSHCVSSLVTSVTVSFMLDPVANSVAEGLSGIVSKVSFRFGTDGPSAFGVGGIVVVSLWAAHASLVLVSTGTSNLDLLDALSIWGISSACLLGVEGPGVVSGS